MALDIALDELRARAARAGLALSEDELKQLLPGVNRAFKQVRDLRGLISAAEEPAGIFSAAPGKKENAK
jgi:hypothetical protein